MKHALAVLSLLLMTTGCQALFGVKLGPGTILRSSEGDFVYQQDDGRLFSAQSSLFYSSALQGQHCQSVSLDLDVGFVEKIDARGCVKVKP